MKYIVNSNKNLFFDLNKLNEIGYFPSFVRLSGEVSEESARDFRRNLSNAETMAMASGQDIIPVVIDSYGGDVYALMSMIDAVKACRFPVATIIEGKAMSAGAVLFMMGSDGHRYMAENSTMMIHEVSSGGPKDKLEELKSKIKHVDELNNKIFKLAAENCGKNKKFFLDEIKSRNNSDWYLSAKECLELGIASHIGIPTLETKIDFSIKFGIRKQDQK